jgi:hypothetical protein
MAERKLEIDGRVCVCLFSLAPSNELFPGAQFRLVIGFLAWPGNYT